MFESKKIKFLFTPAILIFFTGAVFFIANPKVAHAERTTPLTITKGEYSLTASADLVNSWQGSFKRRRSATLTAPLQSLSTIIAKRVFGGSDKNSNIKTFVYDYDPESIYRWVKDQAQKINTEPKEGELTIEDGRATHFIPPVLGVSVDAYTTTFNIINSLQQGDAEATLAASTTEPENSLSELNNLGIKELISRGESKFNGSPKNRRHNIKIGVEKMVGIIVMPGDEFSFNKYLGPVEAYTGFLPELVIKATGTVPEFGGGLCQVSSTTFRAAMQAGLPITQRRNHAYAVQYYAPQGTDATIYPGVIDLKFTNDTGNAILIWPYFTDSDHLVFDFYGTKDGREVTLEKPVQYDRKSDGSMKASWTRIVRKNGEEEKVTFNSTYRSPALYHKTETFVTPPPTTDPTTPPVLDPNAEQPNPNTPLQTQTPTTQ